MASTTQQLGSCSSGIEGTPICLSPPRCRLRGLSKVNGNKKGQVDIFCWRQREKLSRLDYLGAWQPDEQGIHTGIPTGSDFEFHFHPDSKIIPFPAFSIQVVEWSHHFCLSDCRLGRAFWTPRFHLAFPNPGDTKFDSLLLDKMSYHSMVLVGILLASEYSGCLSIVFPLSMKS